MATLLGACIFIFIFLVRSAIDYMGPVIYD